MRDFLEHNESRLGWIVFGLSFLAITYFNFDRLMTNNFGLILCLAIPGTVIYTGIQVLRVIANAMSGVPAEKRHLEQDSTKNSEALDQPDILYIIGDDGELIELDADEKRKHDDYNS